MTPEPTPRDCHHGQHARTCPLCEANREIGEAWAKEVAASALVLDLANALDAEHRKLHPTMDDCETCALLHRAQEWAK